MKIVDIYEDEMYPVYQIFEPINPENTNYQVQISDDLWERYKLAELEFDAVQDELEGIYKGMKN